MEQRDSEISIPEFRDGYTTYKKAVTTSIAPNQVKVLKSKGYYQETINVATVQGTTNGACVQETNKTTRSYSWKSTFTCEPSDSDEENKKPAGLKMANMDVDVKSTLFDKLTLGTESTLISV